MLTDNAPSALLDAARHCMDQKTKPPGSLGELERLAVQLAVIKGHLQPQIDPARILVFAADHGITEAGVSAYPQQVTAQMMANFDAGGAAVCVLANSANAQVEVIDVGVAADISELPGITHAKVSFGSRNFSEAAAMSHEQCSAAMQVGQRAVERAVQAGVECIGLGEMGIGNTSSAAVLTGVLTGQDASQVTGRGTGVDDQRFAIKQAVVSSAMAQCQALTKQPMTLLQTVGGLEIAALTGAILASEGRQLPVLIDGFIVTAAALLACRMNPGIRSNLLFAHQSAESGHALALAELAATPLLTLDMRLGEGSAAALALPIVRAAAAILRDMASFESAGVSTADVSSADGGDS